MSHNASVPATHVITALLNGLPDELASEALLRCCGASHWVAAMLAQRPFVSADAVRSACDQAFATLGTEDWLEAFAHHPKIGDIDSLRLKFAATADLAGSEQAGAQGADETVLRDLAAGNTAYETRFGFIFIICATGKSATAMLAALQERLPHDRATELAIAAGEQQKITHLRLEKLLEGPVAEPMVELFPITTHVLDVARGLAAAGIAVVLETGQDGAWTLLGEAATDEDGRARFPDLKHTASHYRLTFQVASYFAASETAAFYPVVHITFTLAEGKHHHVPLLLSPFGYSTYRGS